ncbi:MAG TPA: hypothetical protein VG204_04805 [Terriglobia bacterium]|nr:hypothetical protein [Terriglobia bacterium]
MVSIDNWWDALVHDRSEAILELVITEISDDYENLALILQFINEPDGISELTPQPARSAVPVSRPEVVKALKELILEGYAQAYILSATEPSARPVDFSAGAIDELWFYVTPKGKDAVKQLCQRANASGSQR